MSNVINLADHMDNFTIAVEGENPNPYGQVLEEHCKAARAGDIEKARRLNEELKKYGVTGYSEEILQRLEQEKKN